MTRPALRRRHRPLRHPHQNSDVSLAPLLGREPLPSGDRPFAHQQLCSTARRTLLPITSPKDASFTYGPPGPWSRDHQALPALATFDMANRQLPSESQRTPTHASWSILLDATSRPLLLHGAQSRHNALPSTPTARTCTESRRAVDKRKSKIFKHLQLTTLQYTHAPTTRFKPFHQTQFQRTSRGPESSRPLLVRAPAARPGSLRPSSSLHDSSFTNNRPASLAVLSETSVNTRHNPASAATYLFKIARFASQQPPLLLG